MNIKAITFKYIYSACTIVRTPDISILSDPWFTPGIIDGSWFHGTKIKDPLKTISNVDIIYISHIDPDHYDPIFLRKYFQRFGKKKIIISDHKKNHLYQKMFADGFRPIILKKELKIGKTEVRIIPHETGSISDIDSAFTIKYFEKKKTHCLVNTNDIVIDDKILNTIRENLKGTKVNLLVCGYTGAGAYPQTYFKLGSKKLNQEIKKKIKLYENKYKKIINFFNADFNIPFAGEYLLGGFLTKYNKYKANPDPIDVKRYDKNALVFETGGEINTNNYKTKKIRKKKKSSSTINKRLKEISNKKMDYERLINQNEIDQLPLKRLLISATHKAKKYSEYNKDFFFIINFGKKNVAVINVNKIKKNSIYFKKNLNNLPKPRCEITIDPRYLFGLITNIYHWNNAEGGSHYTCNRVPNIFNRKVQNFLNFLAI